MKIQLKVLLVAFIFAIMLGVIASIFPVLIFYFNMEIGIYSSIANILGTIRTIISLPLLFFVFYYLGKKIKTTKEFWSYLLSLFLGNLIGSFISRSIVFILYQNVISDSMTNIISLIITLSGYFASSLFSYSFFVGFSALATSYIISKTRLESNLNKTQDNDMIHSTKDANS